MRQRGCLNEKFKIKDYNMKDTVKRTSSVDLHEEALNEARKIAGIAPTSKRGKCCGDNPTKKINETADECVSSTVREYLDWALGISDEVTPENVTYLFEHGGFESFKNEAYLAAFLNEYIDEPIEVCSEATPGGFGVSFEIDGLALYVEFPEPYLGNIEESLKTNTNPKNFARTMQSLRESRIAMFLDSTVNEAKTDKKPVSPVGNKRIGGKKYKEYKLEELKELLVATKDDLKEAKSELRKCKDDKMCVKIEKKIESIEDIIEMINQEIKFRKENKLKESVSSRFARYRKMFESDEENEDTGDDDLSDLFTDEEGSESDDKGEGDKEEDKEDNPEEDTEDTPMTAVVITVKKDDADKCKDEMIEAGIDKDDIEILEGDEDDENIDIKVDANSVMELKKYLDGKGIDLEEKIGGEIVDDSEDEGEEGSESDEEGDDLGDDDFGDLFADDEDSADNADEKKS